MNLDRPRLSIIVILLFSLIIVALSFRNTLLSIWMVICAIFLIRYLNPNRFKRKLKDINDYPPIRKAKRKRLIYLFILGILGTAIFESLSSYFTSLPYGFIFPIGYMASIGLFLYSSATLFTSRYGIIFYSNSNPDERDIQDINRAHKLSFTIVTIAGVIVFFFLPEFFNTFFAQPETSQDFWYLFSKVPISSRFWFFYLVVCLPMLVYAWLEPDPIPE